MQAKKLLTALAAATVMLTPITAGAADWNDVCGYGRVTPAQDLTCKAYIARSEGHHEVAAQFEMLALQVDRGQMTARTASSLANQIVEEQNRRVTFKNISNALVIMSQSMRR